MPTRPIRILKIEQSQARFVLHKENYFGSYLKAAFVQNQSTDKKKSRKSKTQSEPKALENLYNGKLPIKPAKLQDLLHLKQFLTNAASQEFYESLVPDPGMNQDDENDIKFIDDLPIDAE